MGKKACAVSRIGSADGPTSIFIAGKTKKRTISERIRGACYRRKRDRVEKKICANFHTEEEVVAYIKDRYKAKEISKKSYSYKEQYKSLKASLIVRHKPELLGEFLEVKKPKVYNETTLKRFWDRMEQQRKKAESISDKEFPMDFHIYKIRVSKLGEIQIAIDRIWGILDCSYSGNQKEMKRLKRISKDVYRYYGVTEEDIKNHSERYSSFVTILCT